jgi:hypothetical protein
VVNEKRPAVVTDQTGRGVYIVSVRQRKPDNQQDFALGLEPTCPLCGGPARRFGKGPGGIWTCTDNNCALDFTPIVTPRPRKRVEGDK